MSDDNKDFSSDNRISRARERMSTDYDDTLPPRRPAGPAGKGGVASSVLTQFLSSDAGTRKLVYGAAGLGGLLVLGIGGWALLGHHQSGIPVMGPPPVAMRTKPVDPGGMQLDGVAMPDTPDDGQAHPVPAPEKPNPTALAQQYGQQAASTEAADNAKKAADATGDDPDIKEAGPKGTDAGAQGTDQSQAGGLPVRSQQRKISSLQACPILPTAQRMNPLPVMPQRPPARLPARLPSRRPLRQHLQLRPAKRLPIPQHRQPPGRWNRLLPLRRSRPLPVANIACSLRRCSLKRRRSRNGAA